MPETDFIAKGYPGIIAGRKTRLKNEKRIFDSFTFCLHGDFRVPSKDDIANVIRAGHGKVVTKLPSPPKTQEEELARTKFFIICDGTISDDVAQDVYFQSGSHPLGKYILLVYDLT